MLRVFPRSTLYAWTRKVPNCAVLLCLIFFILSLLPPLFAQDEANDAKIIERYKLMLSRTRKHISVQLNSHQIIRTITIHIWQSARTSVQYAILLGQAYAILLQHENAIIALKQAATSAEETQAASLEDLTAIYKALGRAYFRRDRVDEAITAWTKIAELDPENIFTRIELADLLREQELYEQAIAQHEAIIQFKTDDPYRMCLSRREIGNIHEAKGDYAAAIQSYDVALELTAPGNWLRKDLQHRIIGIYAADSDWEGLIEYYQEKT